MPPHRGIEVNAALRVQAFRHGPLWNFSYLLSCTATGEAAIIDPAWDVDSILLAAEQQDLRVGAVVLTHSHGDHAHGTASVVEKTGALVLAHAAEVSLLRRSVFDGPVVDAADEWAIGAVPVRFLHTPGHTPGSLSILADGRLFTGDTMSVGAMGSPAPGSEAIGLLWEALQGRILPLPDATVVHPGHDSGPARSATLAEQRARIPALRTTEFSAFVRELERATGLSFSDGRDGG